MTPAYTHEHSAQPCEGAPRTVPFSASPSARLVTNVGIRLTDSLGLTNFEATRLLNPATRSYAWQRELGRSTTRHGQWGQAKHPMPHLKTCPVVWHLPPVVAGLHNTLAVKGAQLNQ